MRLLVVWLAVSALFAEPPSPKPPPKKLDQALRARAAEFYQDQLDGKFRKAYDLVAKESQDFFFSKSKDKPSMFKIEDIQYSDKFTRAVMKVSTTNRMLVGFHVIDLPTEVVDHWKLEGGKWMWYRDPEADRPNFFGLPVGESAKPTGPLGESVPKDTSPQAVAAAARAALQGAPDRPVLNKASMEFVLGTTETQELLVRNPYNGQVHIFAFVPGESVGITIEPKEFIIDALGEVPVKIHYQALYRQAATASVNFEFQPFSKIFSLPVKIAPLDAPPAEEAKP